MTFGYHPSVAEIELVRDTLDLANEDVQLQWHGKFGRTGFAVRTNVGKLIQLGYYIGLTGGEQHQELIDAFSTHDPFVDNLGYDTWIVFQGVQVADETVQEWEARYGD